MIQKDAKIIVPIAQLSKLVGKQATALERGMNGEADWVFVHEEGKKPKFVRVSTDPDLTLSKLKITKKIDFLPLQVEGLLLSQILEKNKSTWIDVKKIEKKLQAIQVLNKNLQQSVNLLESECKKNEDEKNKITEKCKKIEKKLQEVDFFYKQKIDECKKNETIVKKYEISVKKITEERDNLQESVKKHKDQIRLMERKIQRQMLKQDEPEEIAKKILIGVNIACVLITWVSIFMVFGIEDWYSIFFGGIVSSIFTLLLIGAMFMVRSRNFAKRAVSNFQTISFAIAEVVIHYLCFLKTLTQDVVTNIPLFAICLAILIAMANWTSLWMQKTDLTDLNKKGVSE